MKELPGYPVQNCPSGSFLFWGGPVGRGGIVYLYMILCEGDAPEGHPGWCCIHLYAFVSYCHLSPQFRFSLSAVTLLQLMLLIPFHHSANVLLKRVSDIWLSVFSEWGPIDPICSQCTVHSLFSDFTAYKWHTEHQRMKQGYPRVLLPLHAIHIWVMIMWGVQVLSCQSCS